MIEKIDENGIPKFVRSLLRGGGKHDHEILKLAAWCWLKEKRYTLTDFEFGGFDVIGIDFNPRSEKVDGRWQQRDPLDFLKNRIVIDAKASQGDALQHFKKKSIPSCNIKRKFSLYANLHYLISRKGAVNPSSVRPPWGLLEYDSGVILVRKEAQVRMFIGNDEGELLKLATRTEKLLTAVVGDPAIGEKLEKKINPKILRDEKAAKEEIVESYGQIEKAIQTFEYLYGYNPLHESDEENR